MLQQVTAHFEQTIVVLNVSNILDMSWLLDEGYEHPISSVIYAWHGGMEGGNAIADVLAGEVTPSGKLTDTIAYSIEDYPSTRNYGNELKNLYQEDIYVGYRFSKRFDPQTSSMNSVLDCRIRSSESSRKKPLVVREGAQTVEIGVKVTNIGTAYAGKEVVQVYYEAPQGWLGQPAKVLAAFGKTRSFSRGIAAANAQFLVHAMASYDDTGVTGHRSAYVLKPERTVCTREPA